MIITGDCAAGGKWIPGVLLFAAKASGGNTGAGEN